MPTGNGNENLLWFLAAYSMASRFVAKRKRKANLARALRLRIPKVERSERARYSLKVQVKEKMIYVTRKGFLHR